MGENLPVLPKVTKEECHKFLLGLVNDGHIVFADVDNENKFKKIVEDNFKPQKGGGQTANPPKEIDGVMHYFCRCFKDYLPSDEMVFSGGKCKGISTIGQKLSYEINKKVNETNMEALKAYQEGRIEDGTSLTAKAKELEASLELPQTFIDKKEALELEAKLEADESKNDSDEIL